MLVFGGYGNNNGFETAGDLWLAREYHRVPNHLPPTRLLLVDQTLLLATVALDQITATHTEKLRWAQRETGCRLAILANFAPAQLDVRFLRI